MENIALYIAKACSLTAVFYMAYYLLLRKETFFRANRWFLLAGLATSLLLPLAVVTKVVWVDPAPVTPVKVISIQGINSVHTAPAPQFEFEWWMAALGVYALVAVFLLARLIIDFKKIVSLFKGKAAMRFGRFKIIDSEAAKSPFSFFNYIVLNSASLEPAELQGIISHEKVHSSQRHSIDILLAQLFCTAFWFNPFAWLYKKAISQNLEFIADAEAVKLVSDVTAYQKTLLKMTLELQSNSIASHFYQPLIKKRIIMINKPKSKKRNSAKYAVVLPLLAAFIGLFQIKTEAREKAPSAALQTNTTADSLTFKSVKFTLTKDTTDKTFKESMNLIAGTYNISASYDLDRNDKNEITYVKVALNGNGIDKIYVENNKTTIKNLCIEVSSNIDGQLSASFSNPIDKEEPTYVTVNANIAHQDDGINAINPKGLDNVLYVIDGVIQADETGMKNLDPEQIEAITVLKDATAIEKYGKAAKDGVIEVTTKKQGKYDATTAPQGSVTLQSSSITVVNDENAGGKITSWTVQGAIEVTDTKEGSEPRFRLVNDGNSGFIIKKESTNTDLDFYVKALAQNGITMKYSGIKRNDRGEIMKIKIELTKDGNKAKGEFESFTGINNIYVGERNGMLTAAGMK